MRGGLVLVKGGRAGMPGLRLLANNENGMLTVDFGSAGASPSQGGLLGATEHWFDEDAAGSLLAEWLPADGVAERRGNVRRVAGLCGP